MSSFKILEEHRDDNILKIKASLFVDYFKQSIFVGNIGTDIMCSNRV